MKHLNKKILLTSLLSLALVGCTSSNPNDGNKTSGKDGSDIVDSSQQGSGSKATLTGAYSSPAVMSYMNMRPAYNYYMTTFSFETLDTYSDDTYCLTLSSTTYSGLVLPEEGNNATGGERENYVIRYFGSFESKKNELDESMLDITLKTPNRVIRNEDASAFADTNDFKSYSYTDVSGQTLSYDSAEAFLKANAFKETTISVTTETASFDFHTLENVDENAKVTVKKIGTSLVTSYMTTGSLFYSNMRPNYNYYMTIMNQQTLDIIDDTTYRFTTYSSDFSGLVLPEEGNGATGSDRANYRLSFYGTYTKKTNVLDETMSDFSLSKPNRVTLTYDAAYYVDSDNWDDAAKEHTTTTNQMTQEKTTYATGTEYLASFNTDTKEISVSEESKSFDYIEFANQLY